MKMKISTTYLKIKDNLPLILTFFTVIFLSSLTGISDAQTPVKIETEVVEGITMLAIPGGSFDMGSDAEYADWTEKPVHKVTLSPFYIGRTEITQEQYLSVTGTNPSKF